MPYKLSVEIKNLIKEYLSEEPNKIYRQKIKELKKNNNTKELLECLSGEWSFGTAGIRAKIGAGYAYLNSVSVAKIAYAFGIVLKPHSCISIGFDNRQYSKRYANLIAKILNAQGHKCLIFRDIVPTPVCAFSVKQLQIDAGIMVTASHNASQYNGIKIYNENSIQINFPQIKLIESEIKSAPTFLEIPKSNLPIKYIRNSINNLYFLRIANLLKKYDCKSYYKKKIRIVYSPIHGTGAPFVIKALQNAGFKDIHIVAAQAIPNGEFPTVKSPNPEEASTLKLAIDLANQINADLVLANDPDADRLAVCIKNRILTGNEIGVLLANYLIETLIKDQKEKMLVISTLVSSKMLSRIAKYHGVAHVETTTGFSNIAHRAFVREINFNERFLFGYEEALGYCVGNVVRDKDGISAAVAFVQMFSKFYSENRNVLEELDRLYLLHGLHITDSWYLFFFNPNTFERVIFALEKRGKEINLVKCKSKINELLVYSGEHELQIVIRKSGTENKIKFYAETVSYPKTKEELTIQANFLKNFLKQIKESIMNIVDEEILCIKK